MLDSSNAPPYILEIQNMSKSFPSEAGNRFMDEMASLMAPWGWSRNVARLFAYLLICEEPVSLDRIAGDLGIAKSNASVAARVLEQHGNARRHSQPGTKRILYSAPEHRTGPFASQAVLLGMIAGLLDRYQPGAGQANVAGRLHGFAEFLRAMRAAMQDVLERPGPRG
jgi:hypothetical protein